MKKRVCSVGMACVDLVYFTSRFPVEDSDNRDAEQSWERGGNAANSATVLACLGTEVEFLGTMASDKQLYFLQEDMESLGILYEHCPIVNCGKGPVTVIICTQDTGTRTILHAKGNLPELTLRNFETLDLDFYSWIHFEGRNPIELPGMLNRVKKYNQDKQTERNDTSNCPNFRKAVLPVSLEVELNMNNIDVMLPLADVVIVGKDYARFLGAKNSAEAAQQMAKRVLPGSVVICPWGDEGASYCTVNSSQENLVIKRQLAYVPNQIVDSLGAGDTFNAVIVHCLNNGLEIEKAVNYACLVASKKLEIRGMKGLKGILHDVLPQVL